MLLNSDIVYLTSKLKWEVNLCPYDTPPGPTAAKGTEPAMFTDILFSGEDFFSHLRIWQSTFLWVKIECEFVRQREFNSSWLSPRSGWFSYFNISCWSCSHLPLSPWDGSSSSPHIVHPPCLPPSATFPTHTAWGRTACRRGASTNQNFLPVAPVSFCYGWRMSLSSSLSKYHVITCERILNDFFFLKQSLAM